MFSKYLRFAEDQFPRAVMEEAIAAFLVAPFPHNLLLDPRRAATAADAGAAANTVFPSIRCVARFLESLGQQVKEDRYFTALSLLKNGFSRVQRWVPYLPAARLSSSLNMGANVEASGPQIRCWLAPIIRLKAADEEAFNSLRNKYRRDKAERNDIVYDPFSVLDRCGWKDRDPAAEAAAVAEEQRAAEKALKAKRDAEAADLEGIPSDDDGDDDYTEGSEGRLSDSDEDRANVPDDSDYEDDKRKKK